MIQPAVETSRACPVCGTAASAGSRRLGGQPLFECGGCSMRFAAPSPTPVDYDELYRGPDYWAIQIAPLRAGGAGARFARVATYRPFFEHVGRRPGARLLDVGCGVGRFCHAAADAGWDVTGIDFSAQAIETGKQFARFPLRQATLDQIAAEGRRFESVTAFEVLEHLSEPVRFLREVLQVLQPGGSFFATVPNWNCPDVQTATHREWVPPVHLGFFTPRALEELGRRAGLSEVKVGAIDRAPFGLRPRAALDWALWSLRPRRRHLGLWLHAKAPA